MYYNEINMIFKPTGWNSATMLLPQVILYLINKYGNNDFKNNFITAISNSTIGKSMLETYIYHNYITTSLYTVLSAIRPDLLIDKPIDNEVFPDVILRDLHFITTNTINNAKIMIDLVKTKYPQSLNRDRYLNQLNIILNKDIDFTLFNVDTDDEDNEVPMLLQLAIAVLNSKVLNAIKNLYINNNNGLNINIDIDIPISEIIYDPSEYHYWPGYLELTVSIYLSNNAMIFVNDLSPIDITYQDIVSSTTDNPNIIKIFDPETALRLYIAFKEQKREIYVQSYLDLANEFDKNLMQQLGLI